MSPSAPPLLRVPSSRSGRTPWGFAGICNACKMTGRIFWVICLFCLGLIFFLVFSQMKESWGVRFVSSVFFSSYFFFLVLVIILLFLYSMAVSVCLSVCMPVCLSICLVYLSVCLLSLSSSPFLSSPLILYRSLLYPHPT